MGRFVANSRRGKMKTILALALAALAAAEPEAKPEADAYYGYGYGLGGYYGGYRTYGLGYGHDSTTARGRLRLSPRLMPTTDTDTALAATTVATGLTVLATGTATVCTTARGRLRPSPTTATLPTLLPLL